MLESYKGAIVTNLTNELKVSPQNTWMRLSNSLKARKDLTASAKLVYTHMLDKYTYFSRQNKTYHENMQDIANELGMTKMTVSNSIKKLEELQFLQIFKKLQSTSSSPVISYSYKVNDLYSIYKTATVLKIAKVSDDYEPF